MVRFLLHNTLGAWWAGKVLATNSTLAQTATDENELRAACSLPDYDFDMLRFVREGENGPWRPAAGTFPDWPTEARAITVLDPCCGSGHFLTEALAILAALVQAEEHLSPVDAVVAVLQDNLHGLEIDGRCVQIAAFAVALSAWRLGGWQFYQSLTSHGWARLLHCQGGNLRCWPLAIQRWNTRCRHSTICSHRHRFWARYSNPLVATYLPQKIARDREATRQFSSKDPQS